MIRGHNRALAESNLGEGCLVKSPEFLEQWVIGVRASSLSGRSTAFAILRGPTRKSDAGDGVDATRRWQVGGY